MGELFQRLFLLIKNEFIRISYSHDVMLSECFGPHALFGLSKKIPVVCYFYFGCHIYYGSCEIQHDLFTDNP